MRDKLEQAFRDNHFDMLEARKNGDLETEMECKGYETAMYFVLGLLGADTSQLLKK